MTESLKIRIFDLIPEFFAHAFVLRQLLKPAGAVASGALQSFFYIAYNFFIWILCNMHSLFLLKVSGPWHPLLKLGHLACHFLYLIPENEDTVCLLGLSCHNILGQ